MPEASEALSAEARQVVDSHKGQPIQKAIDAIDYDDWILSMKDHMDAEDFRQSRAYMEARHYLEGVRREGAETV